MGDPAAFRSGREPRGAAPGGGFACSGSPSAGTDLPPHDPRARAAHQKQGAARTGAAPGRASTANVVTVAIANKTAARSGPCWPMTGCTRRTSSASRRRRANEPAQEVAAERLRKVRQGVMANRLDRDPPSLNVVEGREAHRANEARIGRFHQGQRAGPAPKAGCQRRRKNVPARRRKSVPRARWQLVPVVHGRDPRAGRCALRAAGGGPRVGGACGPTGSSGGLFGRLPAS